MSGIIGESKARGSGIISTDSPVISVSGSTGVVVDSDIDHDSLGNFASNEHFTQANITALGTVTSGTISTGTVVDDPTMTQGSDATGDVYYRASDGKLTRLATGADGTVLTSTGVGAVPAFESGAASISTARAWVNFYGGPDPVAIRSSFNVSSITDGGTGEYRVNFDTAMANDDYAFTGDIGALGYWMQKDDSDTYITTTYIDIQTRETSTAMIDKAFITCIIYATATA